MFPIDELCDEVVDSSHVGMRKPDREIYELTCARMGIDARPRRCSSTTTPTTSRPRAPFGMEAVHFGDDPWDALAELDAILDRRGRAYDARAHAPLIVISPTSTVMPATAPGRNVRSAPISAMSSSMRCSVDAIVTSRTGSANAPSRTMSPSAPTEKSPLIGFVPECRPLTDCT